MKFYHWLALLVAAICLGVQLASWAEAAGTNEQVAQPESSQSVPARHRFQLPKIFDFELYKRLFKKVYHGLEETVRRKYMLARALRAWISSLKYKYRASRFYLAINHMSDMSPEELAQMENQHSADKLDTLVDIETTTSSEVKDDKSIPEIDPNHIEQDLDKLIDGDDGQMSVGLKELCNELKKQQVTLSTRTKRDLGDQIGRPFDMDRLISSGVGASLDSQTARKVQVSPKSNNPDYWSEAKPKGPSSTDARNEYFEMPWYMIKTPPQLAANKYSLQVAPPPPPPPSDDHRGRSKLLTRDPHEPTSDELADEVFLDHRYSRCMFLPRAQGRCGSCYAFSMVAIAEWLHCKQTGELVAFSEQYLVDCGKATNLTYGCRGADVYSIGDFVHNYGLELRAEYPYRARQDHCPYDQNTEPKSMGYIRMDYESGLIVPRAMISRRLQVGPMYADIFTRGIGFQEYGGGVMDVDCQVKSSGSHAVVLIGHGREDGKEYWLIRNSYGVDWGEKGHYKLAKDSDCIVYQKVYLFGTIDGKSYQFKPNRNKRNDKSVVKGHYARNMLADLNRGQY